MKNNTKIEYPRHSWISLNRIHVIELITGIEKILDVPGVTSAHVLSQIQACLLVFESDLHEPVDFEDPNFDLNGYSFQDYLDQIPQNDEGIVLLASSRYVLAKVDRLTHEHAGLSLAELVEKVLDEEPKFVGPYKGEMEVPSLRSLEHREWELQWELVKSLIISEDEDESQLTQDELIKRMNNNPAALELYSENHFSKLSLPQLTELCEQIASISNDPDGDARAEVIQDAVLSK